ncbi:hypothetical protein IDJ75_09985 [Mucilaginibacter rigui]|uniref:Transposase IS204/IS1001/IS1096/IS1165 zinc-finger domain-containing protein n=1 Tax=Mucilaginibacter rigui TaxID=534635 RepID=A0ABR7X537_9SPHI|nr:hypothetical protein [Mucilaginibacter rigui]
MELIFNEQKAKPQIDATAKQKVSCPRCGRSGCERVKRGSIVKIFLPWLKLRRYQCHGCLRYFYRLKNL